mgnify:CR=1 FL=1
MKIYGKISHFGFSNGKLYDSRNRTFSLENGEMGHISLSLLF